MSQSQNWTPIWKANLDALKLTLDEADRKAIAALPKDQRFVNPGFAPIWD